MASGGSSRKEPQANGTGSTKSKKQQTVKLTDSIVSSPRSSPMTTAPPSMNGDAPSSSSKGKKSAAPDSSQGDVETQQCKHCKKYVPKEGFSGHSKQCLRDKKERKRQKEAQAAAAQAAIDNANANKDAEGDLAIGDSIAVEIPAATLDKGDKNEIATPGSATAPKNAKKSTTPAAPDSAANAKNSKKRKADDTPTTANAESASKPPPPKKQKKKEEAKPKVAKPKGPVDVEKQCGVLLPNGAMCARSLTCKSHSMGAKRAVPGRSLPYDALLHQYQKKNQAKQQKAAMASTAPLAEDSSLANGPVDSDEEREAVMAGISRAAPLPLYEKPMLSARQRYTHVRLKEMLSNALGGTRGSGLFVSAPRSMSVADDGAGASAGAGSEWEGSRRMSGVQA